MPSEHTERLAWSVYQVRQALLHAGILDWLDLLLIVALAYVAMAALARGRASRVAWGIAIVVLVYWVAVIAFPVLSWVLYRILLPGSVGLMILFQGELRTFLAHIGGALARGTRTSPTVIDALADACVRLSRDRMGMLVALERAAPLTDVVVGGVRLDAALSAEMLRAVFHKTGPLHDGGAVVSGDRILAATCQFPTSTTTDLDVTVGMRHRAAIGLSEQTDAVCVVVSEQTGAISLAAAGRLRRNLSREDLQAALAQLLGEPRGTWIRRLLSR